MWLGDGAPGRDHAAAERLREPRHLFADVAHADNADRLAKQFLRHVAHPFVLLLRADELRGALREHEHLAEDVFADRRGVQAADRRHRDAALDEAAVEQAIGAGAGELDPLQMRSHVSDRTFARERLVQLRAPESEDDACLGECALQTLGDGRALALAGVAIASQELPLVLAEHRDLDALWIDGLDLLDEIGLEREGDEDVEFRVIRHIRPLRASRHTSRDGE